MLHLNLSQDTQGETVATPTGPAGINAQSMRTQVRVANGQTLALGEFISKHVLKMRQKCLELVIFSAWCVIQTNALRARKPNWLFLHQQFLRTKTIALHAEKQYNLR